MAIGINTITLSGRLTRDAERKEFTNAFKDTFSIAVEKRIRNGEKWETKTNFFEIEVWNIKWLKDALTKGKQIVVTGELDTSEYTNKDGQKIRKVYVRANRVQTFDSSGMKAETQKPAVTDDDEWDIP